MFHIAISGFAGNGKTTTLELVRDLLDHDGYNVMMFSELPRLVKDSQSLFFPYSHSDNEDLFQFAIFQCEIMKRELLKSIPYQDNLIVLHDRTWLDNLIFAVLKKVISYAIFRDILFELSDEKKYHYDLVFLLDSIPDHKVADVMKDKVRAETITDFKVMEKRFYQIFLGNQHFLFKSKNPDVQLLPSVFDFPLVPLKVYTKILNFLRGGN